MSIELLSQPIRKYIYDQGWESLRPIQAAAIKYITSTDYNFILASRTASGKTEAAFLPVLSTVNFSEPGVKVLYISPLIALINDQFFRIEEVCKYLDITVTKWHGEANRTLKNKLIKNPNGIVLITPESLEAMFSNSPFIISTLFSNLKYLIIDEIHSFIGTDRGIHLKSIISRLQQINNVQKFKILGLSATIGDYNQAKRFTGNEEYTKVLLDKEKKETECHFRFFKSDHSDLPTELIEDLYEETKSKKVLIFPNSRGRAEEVAVRLQKLSQKLSGHPYYFSHHSSVDKEIREYVEEFAKTNRRYNFCISCTSTLELGIDIGTVDEVVQIDSTHSISSLIQRVGRSGRRADEKSNLILYATTEWSLLQSLACFELYKEGFIEPLTITDKPYDILLHQILSIIKETSGCTSHELMQRINKNFAFTSIQDSEIQLIINHLHNINFLESIEKDLIIGLEGEKLVNSKDFYSVFKSEPNLKILFAGRRIGEIPFSPQIKLNENILLAAKIWKIKDIDFGSNKIEVIPATDGKKPVFFGAGGNIHYSIREKMLSILVNSKIYPELDENSNKELATLAKDFSNCKINNLLFDRPYINHGNSLEIFTFQSTRVNRSFYFLAEKLGLDPILTENSSSIKLKIENLPITTHLEHMSLLINNVDDHLEELLRSNQSIMDFSKWGSYLPERFQIEILKVKYFDFSETQKFLENIKLVPL